MTEVIAAGRSATTQTRSGLVARAVETWVKQLIDLGGSNRLLYYRDLKRGTLDLTTALQANPAQFQRLLAGQPVSLSQLFQGRQLEIGLESTLARRAPGRGRGRQTSASPLRQSL